MPDGIRDFKILFGFDDIFNKLTLQPGKNPITILNHILYDPSLCTAFFEFPVGFGSKSKKPHNLCGGMPEILATVDTWLGREVKFGIKNI